MFWDIFDKIYKIKKARFNNVCHHTVFKNISFETNIIHFPDTLQCSKHNDESFNILLACFFTKPNKKIQIKHYNTPIGGLRTCTHVSLITPPG